MKRVHSLTLGLIIFSVSSVSQTFVSRDSLVRLYCQIDQPVFNSISDRDTLYNYEGMYAWGYSDYLCDEIRMFVCTGDTFHVRHFTRLANLILKNRDDRRHLADWKGEIKPGWSSRRRWDPKLGRNVNGGLPVRDLVEDARIVQPYLEFTELVFSDSVRHRDLLGLAREYLNEAQLVIQGHIRESWNSLQNRLVNPKGSPIWADGVNMPNNYEAQFGSDLIRLFRLTGNTDYRALALKLAHNLHSGMVLKDSCYLWYYWSGRGFNGWNSQDNVSVNTPSSRGQKNYEDISHGGLDLDFILDCFEAGIEFSRTDIQYIINTYKKKIDDGSRLASDVSGVLSPGFSDDYRASYSWIRLTQFHPSIYGVFYRRFFAGHQIPRQMGSLTLLADLLRYYPVKPN